MRTARALFRIVVMLALTAALWAAVPLARANGVGTTILVNTTTNTLGDGLCSLQEAVDAANSNISQDAGACPAGSGTDTITFSIGTGFQSIAVNSNLYLAAPVVIDGTTQPIYAGVPLIEITGSLESLLTVYADGAGSTIKGIRFKNTYTGVSTGYGVRLQGGSVVLEANYFNTDGSTTWSNPSGGIYMDSSNNLVGTGLPADRNLFGGQIGIYMHSGSLNIITGNHFGVQASDPNALQTGITGTGFAIFIAPADATCANNTIRDNVIAGWANGVRLNWPANHITVAHNIIGLGASGSTSLGNWTGVYIAGAGSNTIGGTSTGDRNVISASTGDANIFLTTSGSDVPADNIIQGNYIGTTANGLSLANWTRHGIEVYGGQGTEIGGTADGSGNLISGHDVGVAVYSGALDTIIRGNWIGLDAAGDAALGNKIGIQTFGGAINAGDDLVPGNNLISGHMDASFGVGVWISSSSGSTVVGNRFGLNATNTGAVPNNYGVLLEYASATVARNWIANSALGGLAMMAGATVGTGSSYNCLTNTSGYAAQNTSGTDADLTSNWWGEASGPTHPSNPGGTGGAVSDDVLFSPFLRTPPATCPRSLADYDGDAAGDPALFEKATGNWFVVGSTEGFFTPALGFGNSTSYIPVPGDYDGDTRTDAAVFEKATGNWFAVGSALGFSTPALNFGNTTAYIPVEGDYDGDGRTDAAVFEKTTGHWFVVGSTAGFFTPALGFGNDTSYIPVPGDYDGDGSTDPAVFEKATGHWFVVGSTAGFFTPALGFGDNTNYIPVQGDYDADGKTDPAVFQKATGHWFVVGSTAGFFTPALGFGNYTSYIPQPADYDGDGKTDPGVFERATGHWFVVGSDKGFFTPALGFGNDTFYAPVVRRSQ